MSKKQLITKAERDIIELRLRGKWSLRRIARFLVRDHTVISREVKRNCCEKTGRYSAKEAERKADERSRGTNVRKIDIDAYLKRYIIQHIRDLSWSPEQIAGRLKQEYGSCVISHEAIYQWIYDCEPWLYKYLRKKKRPKRQKRYSRKRHLRWQIPRRVSINQRPSVVAQRRRFGDWESDSMKFSKQKTALSVQYERTSMLVRITKVENLGKDETLRAITENIDVLPPDSFKTITFDNGGEAARHTELNDAYGIDTFFCDPYKSWQKGGVENMNGLVRQYLPRCANLKEMTQKTILSIQEKLNNRPRKKLNYKTPNEVFFAQFNPASGALNS